jgi:uncharacterized membrane protein
MFMLMHDDFTSYRLGTFDLGSMVNAVWNTAHGRPLETTSLTGEQVSRLGGHVDPVLVLLAPLWILVPSPLTLAGFQIVALALGAFPVFWLARHHLEAPVAVTVAVAYLLYPWLAWSALDAIHPVTLAIPLLILCVWALDRDRLVLFAVAAGLTLTCGELLGLSVAALGVWYALARGNRKAGALIAGAGVSASLVALYVVVPAFSGHESGFFGFYSAVGGSPEGIVATAFTHPLRVLGQLFHPYVLLFIVALVAPLAGLFFLSAGLAAAATPQLLLNALADPDGPIDPRQHYIAAIFPFLMTATIFGIARLRPAGRAPAAVAIVVLSLALSLLFAPWAGGRDLAPLWYQTSFDAQHVRALDRAVAAVPAGVPASVSNVVGAHLATRRRLLVLPDIEGAQWIVLDTHDVWLPDSRLPALARRTPGELIALRDRIESSGAWSLVLSDDGVYVFRRRGGR